MGKPGQKAGSGVIGTAAVPWWNRLLHGASPTEAPRPVREVWSPESREYYRAVVGLEPLPADFYPVRPFYHHLVAEFERTVRQSRPLAVVVFQLPDQGSCGGLHWPDLEIALRREVRREDLPARLAERVAALCLPNTGEGAAWVATRLERGLSRLIGGPVTAGAAYYPLDGPTALE